MDIERIIDQIREDKEKKTSSYRRYPVRFLFLEMSNDTQNEIMSIVQKFKGKLLDLSDYIMKKDDGWMTKSRLIKVVKDNTTGMNDVFVLGFSEIIRFFSNEQIQSTVLSLFDIENNDTLDPIKSKKRIIFVCFSMMDNVYKVLQKCFSRRDLINPFINPDSSPSGEYREVCFVSSDYQSNIKTNRITSSVEWVGLWRNSSLIDFSKPIWCCSDNLYGWYEKSAPDNAFQIDIVNNSKEYLDKACGFVLDIPYLDDESKFWNQLKDDIVSFRESISPKDAISQLLDIDGTSCVSLAGKYLNASSDYSRWLVRNYVKLYFPSCFLDHVFMDMSTWGTKSYLESVWRLGYSIDGADLLEERIEIIRELNNYTKFALQEDELKSIIQTGVKTTLSCDEAIFNGQWRIDLDSVCSNGLNRESVVNLLRKYYADVFKPAYTGISMVEKEFVINLCSCDVLSEGDIYDIYPSLHSYLYGRGGAFVEGNEDIKDYLNAYRWSKVYDNDSGYLDDFYKEGRLTSSNVYSLYYRMKHQEDLIKPFMDDADIYVLDGVGAEYLQVLVSLIQNKGYEIELCEFASCHLPSITEVNKRFLSKLPIKEWIVDFDRDVIHGEFYRMPNNLRKALSLLEALIERIFEESSGRRIVITADHGATARAKWMDTRKKYNFSESDHEGRCCKIQSKGDYEETDDYIVYEDDGKPGDVYVISINETSLYNRPKYEDHGGATIEEMIVPVIVAAPKREKSYIVYKAHGDKLEVSGLDKVVRFTIIPPPNKEVYLFEKNGTKHVLEKDGKVYSTELSSGVEQDVKLVVGDYKFDFHIMNRSRKNMEGDDGFDD